MNILKVWIIAQNGLQLINVNIRAEDGEYKIEAELFKNGNNITEGHMRASAISSFTHFFEKLLIGKPCTHILFENIILYFHRWSVRHYNPNEVIAFTVITVAEVDLTVPIMPQENVIKKYAELVSLEFYYKHQKDLKGVDVNLNKLESFSETCEELSKLSNDKLDERLEYYVTELEKRLGTKNNV